MTKSLAIRIIQIIAVCLVIFFSIIMLKTISQYTSFEKNVGFLMFKQQVVNHPCWLTFLHSYFFHNVLSFGRFNAVFESVFI